MRGQARGESVEPVGREGKAARAGRWVEWVHLTAHSSTTLPPSWPQPFGQVYDTFTRTSKGSAPLSCGTLSGEPLSGASLSGASTSMAADAPATRLAPGGGAGICPAPSSRAPAVSRPDEVARVAPFAHPDEVPPRDAPPA